MIRALRTFTFGHLGRLVKPCLWIFFENFCSAAPSILAYLAINVIVSAQSDPASLDTGALWAVAAAMAALLLVQLGASYGATLGTFLPVARNSAQDKASFVEKLRCLPLGYFQKRRSGELINAFTGDFLNLEQAMVAPVTGIFSMVLFSVWAAVVMALFNPTMAAAFYACLPAAAIVTAVSLRVVGRLTARTASARDASATFLNEYLQGMRTLKSYNQMGEGFGKLKGAYEALMAASIRSESVGGALLNFASALIKLGIPILCFTGAYLILGGRLSMVDYLALLVFSTKIVSPLLTQASYLPLMRGYYTSAARVDSVMREEPLRGEGRFDATSKIRFDHVSFSYGKSGGASPEPANLALADVSFSIPAGKLTAIVGPSGSGKSTILRLLARFWDVTDGRILCGEGSLSDADPEEWQRQVSMVMQDVYLFNDTVRGNILFGRGDATDEEMIAAAKRAQCHDFIMALPQGYDTMVGEGGSTLSGGEKQRISIARALLKDAPLLLLDEPTASLDARNETLVQRALSEVVQGRTVVMIAHRLKTVRNADQILVVDRGRVVERGRHDELMALEGTYARLWRLQNESRAWRL